jgi:acyl-CoA reductase-like NAD-dependent aldehyde dehydrogenase
LGTTSAHSPQAAQLTPDERLERDIQRAKDQFMAAKTPADRRAWLRTMESLIKSRSPEQVKRMERAQGLSPIR